MEDEELNCSLWKNEGNCVKGYKIQLLQESNKGKWEIWVGKKA